MNLTGCHFVYADTSSRSYKLWFAHCDTSEHLPIHGTIESVTLFNARGNRNYLISDSYEDSAITFETEIITEDASPIPLQQIREAERWLFGRKNYYPLFVDIADDCDGESYELVNGEVKRFYLNCRFMNPEKIYGNGGTVGWKVTVECDSCLAWQEPVTKTIDISETGSLFEIEVDSDMNEYVYPKVTFQMLDAFKGYDGDIRIVNFTDSSERITGFKNITASASVITDGNINYISGDNYSKFINKNFVRLLPGTNSLSVEGNVKEVTFEWSNRRYL